MSTIKLTLEQVKKDAKMIYYSSHCLWWTHSENDLKEATELGLIASAKNFERFMNDPSKPDVDKKRMSALRESLDEHHKKHGRNVPTDPWGSPLFQIEADKWIEPAEKKPDHFKKYGLDAFMKTHHQNSRSGDHFIRFANWDQVTEFMDGYNLVAKRFGL